MLISFTPSEQQSAIPLGANLKAVAVHEYIVGRRGFVRCHMQCWTIMGNLFLLKLFILFISVDIVCLGASSSFLICDAV